MWLWELSPVHFRYKPSRQCQLVTQHVNYNIFSLAAISFVNRILLSIPNFSEYKCKREVSSHGLFWDKLRCKFEATIKHRSNVSLFTVYLRKKTLVHILIWAVTFRNSLITQPCCFSTWQQSYLIKAVADRLTQTVLKMSVWLNSQQHSITLIILTEGQKSLNYKTKVRHWNIKEVKVNLWFCQAK